MRKILITIVSVSILYSCKESKKEGGFEVSGKITNNPGTVAYLEEIPMTTMQRVLIDSVKIDKQGKYSLKAAAGEAKVYNIRLDQNTYPLASVINDSKHITLDATFNKANTQFAETYEVKNSPASEAMKGFMVAFNGKMQSIYMLSLKADSVRRLGRQDSLLSRYSDESLIIAGDARKIAMEALEKSSNPALSMFILGYYQSTASNPGYRLTPLNKNEVTDIIGKVAAKYPDHKGVASIMASLQGWVGKQAPDFTLPDPNGKQISVSSFRGKYLLVDFWASWCRPCRNENPNVVKVYNKYKDKNFAILGVSLDRPGQKDAWMKAVMDDQLTWTQVSDLMYWDSPVVNLYKFGEQGIPYNVLIDPNGKIIAEALRGEELDAKLAEVLK